MKFADYVLIITVAACFIAALVYTHRRSKSGGCMGCGSGSGSSSSCCGTGGVNSSNVATNSCGGCSGCSSRNNCSGYSNYRSIVNDDSSDNYHINAENSCCR